MEMLLVKMLAQAFQMGVKALILYSGIVLNTLNFIHCHQYSYNNLLLLNKTYFQGKS